MSHATTNMTNHKYKTLSIETKPADYLWFAQEGMSLYNSKPPIPSSPIAEWTKAPAF